MYSKCPGQDGRNLRVEVYKCPKCGTGVEIFSDETRAKCQKCGQKVYKEKLPSCIEWCAKARECLGEERWRELKGEDDSVQEGGSNDSEAVKKNR